MNTSAGYVINCDGGRARGLFVCLRDPLAGAALGGKPGPEACFFSLGGEGKVRHVAGRRALSIAAIVASFRSITMSI